MKETVAEQAWRGIDCFQRDEIGLVEILLRRLDNQYGIDTRNLLLPFELNAIKDAMRRVPEDSRPGVVLFAGEITFLILVGIHIGVNKSKDSADRAKALYFRKLARDRESLAWLDGANRNRLAKAGARFLAQK